MPDTVTLPKDIQRRLDIWKAAGALVLCAFYGWFALVRNAQTPILEFADIAVHEVGHKLFSPFGELIMLIMGSGFQVLFPLVLGVVFAVWKHNLIAWGVCWAWAANAMCDAARYIYDAPRGELMLLGGGGGLGDWSRILGPEHYDKLYLADRLAADVRTLGFVTWFAAIGIVIFALVREAAAAKRDAPAGTQKATARPSGALAPVRDVEMWRR
jgi:hypothetical protein